jgi:hypothetical protein
MSGYDHRADGELAGVRHELASIERLGHGDGVSAKG